MGTGSQEGLTPVLHSATGFTVHPRLKSRDAGSKPLTPDAQK